MSCIVAMERAVLTASEEKHPTNSRGRRSRGPPMAVRRTLQVKILTGNAPEFTPTNISTFKRNTKSQRSECITFLYCSFHGGVLHLYCERWREMGSGCFGKQSAMAAIFLLPANVENCLKTGFDWSKMRTNQKRFCT